MKDRLIEAETLAEKLLCSQKYFSSDFKPSDLPIEAGVYAIFDKDTNEALYACRTKNLRRRLFTNHLMGSRTKARLKKYLIEDPLMMEIKTLKDVKNHLKTTVIVSIS